MRSANHWALWLYTTEIIVRTNMARKLAKSAVRTQGYIWTLTIDGGRWSPWLRVGMRISFAIVSLPWIRRKTPLWLCMAKGLYRNVDSDYPWTAWFEPLLRWQSQGPLASHRIVNMHRRRPCILCDCSDRYRCTSSQRLQWMTGSQSIPVSVTTKIECQHWGRQ